MFTSYRKLSENAQRLLCVYAYASMGSQKSLREIKSLLHTYFSDFSETSIAPEDELIENGMFVRKGFSWYTNQYNYVLTDHTFVPALWYTLEERKDLAEAFKRISIQPSIQYNHLRQALTQLVASDYTTCSNAMYLRPDDARYFAQVCMVRNFRPLYECMPGDTFDRFFMKMIYDLLENDIVAETKYLQQLIEGNRALPLPITLKLNGFTELYAFIAHGTLPKHDIKANDFGGLTLTAIHRILQGNYSESVKLFQLALKIYNKTADMKNMYLASLLNYYLVVAYAHEGSADSKNKLRQFLNKSNISEYYILIPSRIIAEQTLQSGKDWHREGVRNLLVRADMQKVPRTVGHLAYLLDRYYDLKATDDISNLSLPTPRMALLRHELAEYLNLTDTDRSQLKSLFGPAGALTSVRHKADWELSLERLLSIGREDDNHVDERTSRLMYVMHSYRGGIEIREQTRLKNGTWGSGKAVNYTRFLSGEIDCMDDADRRIMNRFRSSNGYDLQLEHLVEEMKHESRLYFGDIAPYELVKVTEEKPYLIVEREKQSFRVRSNVPQIRLDDALVILHKSDEHIAFIRIPENQRIIYRELLSTGSYPLEAEEILRKALAHVGGTVEIHSPLIEGGSTLPTIQGEAMACVRLSPSSDEFYTISISAHPVIDGECHLSLAQGDELYIDEHEGKRVWVQRNMEEEMHIAHLFTDFFLEQQENGDTDFRSPDIMLNADSRLELDPVEMLTLLDFIQKHPDCIYAEWPEGKKARIRTMGAKQSSWSATLHERGMWFQLEGEIQIDDHTKLTVSELLDLASLGKGRYIKLGEGEYLALSERLQRQLKALEAVANRNKGGDIQISPFSAALLGSDALDGDIRIFMSDNLVQLRKRILDSENYKPEIPKELNATLRPYQIDGYQWMARLNSWGAGALLADDMGLGKTIQTIAFLLLKANEGASLVVAPASVAPNWKVEFTKFAPSLNAIILNFEADRRKAIENAGPGDVIITTYGILLSEQDSICARKWNVACLDEAHIIKNRGAKTSAAAMRIQADNRVILTGTPVQNHLSELWSLFQFINPGLLGGYEVFSRKFITPIERDGSKACQERLDKVVHPFMLRRTKNAVLQELPEKTEIYQRIELSTEEMAVYEVIRDKAERLLESQKDERIDFNVLAEITRLRQASCSPRLVQPQWNGDSSKVTALVELLQGVIEGDNHALVFSQFTSFLDIVRERLDAEGMEYLYIDGSVPVKRRTELVEQFQQGKCPIFIISLKAGGLGLNLTNANYVFHLDPWWNPAIEQQATDRAYRIGQRQAVTVYHLIAENTIEEKIIRLHEKKRTLAENILDGTDISHHLTGKDLLEMVAK